MEATGGDGGGAGGYLLAGTTADRMLIVAGRASPSHGGAPA